MQLPASPNTNVNNVSTPNGQKGITWANGNPDHTELTHLPLGKMAAVSQTIFSDAFSWMNFFALNFTEVRF